MLSVTTQDIMDQLLTGTEAETFNEELFNTVTHGFGIISAILGFYLLLVVTSFHPKRSIYNTIGALAFGLALISVFSISTIYHSAGLVVSDWRFALRKLDHCVIYLVIAGSYTPLVTTLIMEKGKHYKLGNFVLALEWVSAACGIFVKLFVPIENIPPLLSNGYYLFMGWAIVLIFKPAYKVTPIKIGFWILMGGLSYSFGVGFLIFDSLHFNHGIWHIFVFGGALSHFIAVMMALTDTTDFRSMVANVKSLLINHKMANPTNSKQKVL